MLSPAARDQQNIRFDIQFLRGVAVLLVVLFHGLGDFFPRGFLGVDIFFVLSGFLITGIILRAIAAGSFSLPGFYLRRAKRLLPAAYSTFLGTTLIGYAVLTRAEWGLYLLQLFGSVTFTANMVLWAQTDYFAAAAEAKPLLHIWSLSLEEQFYFVMPILLLIVAGRFRLAVIAAGFAISLGLCVLLASSAEHQALAFFMLPTRAWQLLAGSLCAWIVLHRPGVTVPPLIQRLGLATILATALIGIDSIHPRGDAIIVVAATALLILGRDNWLPLNMVTRAVATIGDWSYSLYLVHWPLFSFAYIVYLGDPPTWTSMTLIVVALLLAWLQYRFVETPFRYAWPTASRRAWATFAAMTIGLGLSAAPAAATRAGQAKPVPPVLGLAKECRQRGSTWQDLPRCRTSSVPTVAVWGDSNAMHLIPGLRSLAMVQLTKSACTPALGIAQMTDTYNDEWAEGCISFNDSAFRYIVDNPDIRGVVVAAAFHPLLYDDGQRHFAAGRNQPFGEAGRRALVRTLIGLKEAGKTPVLVAPLPQSDFDPGRCNVRVGEGGFIAGRDDCNFEQTELSQQYIHVRDALRLVARQVNVPLVEPESVICQRGVCRTTAGALSLYRDKLHLSEFGARSVVRRLDLQKAFQHGTAPPNGL